MRDMRSESVMTLNYSFFASKSDDLLISASTFITNSRRRKEGVKRESNRD